MRLDPGIVVVGISLDTISLHLVSHLVINPLSLTVTCISTLALKKTKVEKLLQINVSPLNSVNPENNEK